MKTKIALVAAAILMLQTGCSTPPPQKTSLEMQQIQSREFETTKEIGFASVVSIFQDLGYIIQSADKDTGFITANSPTKNTKDWLFTGNNYNTQTKATAFVEQIRPGFTRVRLNFVTTTQSSAWYGQTGTEDQPIQDAAIYQKAFEKIEDAIFVRSGTK